MKIIFSPTKEMKLENPVKKDWKLSKYSKPLIEAYKNTKPIDLSKMLKVNESVFEQVESYRLSLETKTTYPAIHLYNGLSFRTLSPSTLDESNIQYLDENLLILSAFYGPISPLSLIKPYRLDFMTTFKVDGITLGKYWKTPYNESIKNGETVLNLASNEFSDLFDEENYNWYDFEFHEENNGKLRQHSTISKKGRASVLRYLAENMIEDIEDIKSFENHEVKKDGNKFIIIKK